jgi:hypothetical protein
MIAPVAGQPWLNNPIAASAVVRPRMRVILKGIVGKAPKLPRDGRRDDNAYAPAYSDEVELRGAWRATIDRNNWYHGDRFSIEAPLFANPGMGIDFWSRQPYGLLVEIQASLREGAWETVVFGRIDRTEMHPATGVVILEGRDLTATFIESRTQEPYQNETASEVVEKIAAQFGIRAQVTRTTALVRSYYVRDHVLAPLASFSNVRTYWDLMVMLAQFEGFDIFVQGDTLYFQPPTPASEKPFVVQWRNPLVDRGAAYGRESNVIDLRLSRDLTLARDIEVEVRSWSSRGGQGFVRTARAIGARPATPAAAIRPGHVAVQRIPFVVPNLAEEQAQRYAEHQLRLITANARHVSFKIPGDLRVTPRTLIEVQGTQSDWDQRYYIDHISMSLDFEGGFNMAVTAKNRDTRSQVTP